MIDITKEEFWDNKVGITKTKQKNNIIKGFVIKNKMIIIILITLGILILTNTILIYKFYNILINVK